MRKRTSLLLAGLVFATVAVLIAPVAPAKEGRVVANAITVENARPGTLAWQRPPAPVSAIAGYTLAPSAAPGAKLGLAVSTSPAARYRVELYRLGWYGGKGARLIECLPSCTGSEAGAAQREAVPDWSHDGIAREKWRVTDTIAVQRSWTSGYYLAELVLASGPARGKAFPVPFIVQGPAGNHAAIIVQAPVNTWQAYNDWGGTSTYTGPGGQPASRASFDRPYTPTGQSPLYWEYPLIRFIEKNGYDVTYTTDVDVDRNPAQLLRHKLVVVPGHSEYWTSRMRNALDTARDRGVNLAFLGGNDGYWQARYDDGGRTLVEYHGPSLTDDGNPAHATLRFRDLSPPRPECELIGVEWQGGWIDDGLEPSEETVATAHSSQAYTVSSAALSDSWFAGTGFTAGSAIPGIVGYEWDSTQPGCVPNATTLFHYEGAPYPDPRKYTQSFLSTNADVVRYTAASGATVFAAGSIEFSWGLDGYARRLKVGYPDKAKPDPRLQRFMRNAFDAMTR